MRQESHLNQTGFLSNGIVLIIGVAVLFAGLYILGKEYPKYNIYNSIFPQPVKTTYQPNIFDEQDLGNGKLLIGCQKGLTQFSKDETSILKENAYVDLSDNKLTSLEVTDDWKNIKELNLSRNNFSPSEQAKIKKELPNTVVAFFPQNGIDLSITNQWKTFSSPSNNFTFKYYPDLLVSETYRGADITSDMNLLKNSQFVGCSNSDDQFFIRFSEEPNPQNLTPLEFLTKDLAQNDFGDTTFGQNLIQTATPPTLFKNGQINGYTFDAVNSKYRFVYAQHGDKMYVFQAGNEGVLTENQIETPASQLFMEILSTVKFSK